VLARLGVSVRYGGQDLVDSLKAKYNVVEQNAEKEGGEKNSIASFVDFDFVY
jgi:hypothetical protein